MSFTVSGISVYSDSRHITRDLPIIIQAPKFIQYIETLDRNLLDITGIRVDAVKWFCNPVNPLPSKLGFLWIEVIAADRRTGNPLPGVVFLRGGAVAVYMRVKVEDRLFTILTEQIRVPMGGKRREIPAGMLDANECFAGVMMNEIAQETGLTPPSIDELIPLGIIEPSAGGCDETIHLFYWETEISVERKDELLNTIHGEPDENESIRLHFVDAENYENVLHEIGDVKAICAHYYARRKGLLIRNGETLLLPIDNFYFHGFLGVCAVFTVNIIVLYLLRWAS